MGLNLLNLFQPTNPDKPLGGRYKIISQLGAGGFGQTFLAQDLHLPGHPQCVVKQLKPQVNDEKSLQTARRLFDIEAKVLYQLGNHDQIPRLLAHFEDNQEFYLAQELIEGEPLTQELTGGRVWSQAQVISLLQDLLQVLAFVHEQQVIHRDIKPSNLIRRQQDGRIVLIDFGAVKEASTQITNPHSGDTKTISIGTQGYTPKEQLGGNPRFSSDIYAAGMLAIQALTGTHPRRLSEDAQTGEIVWRDRVPQISPELAAILECMVRYDFRDRYPTATEALEALRSLPSSLIQSSPLLQELSEATETPTRQAPQTPSSATSSTGSGIDQSSTNIWVPAQPPVESRSVSSTGPTNPLHQPQRSLNPSASSAPTVAAPGSTQKSSLNPWLVLPVLAVVGAIAWMAKPLVFPQPATETADRSSVGVESPNSQTTANPVREPLLSSPNSTTPESPTESPVKESPSAAVEGKTTEGSTNTSVKESPVSASANQTPATPATSSTPVPVAAKPTPPAAPPAAKPTPATAPPAAQPAPPSPAPQANNAQASWERCYSLNTQQQYAKAIAACDQALAVNPNYPEALWSKGFALDQQKQHQAALALYERATTLKPDFAEAWSNRGASLLVLGRPNEAVAAFDKATALKPDLAAAWRDRGAALLDLGRFDEAIASVERSLQLQPNDEYALNLLMTARIKQGR